MILRKPYRILIKNFKLIHFILGICSAYLLSKTLNLMNFFNEYQTSSETIISAGTSNKYFSGLFIGLSLLVFFGSIIILIIMQLKKKPVLFYIVNIIAYIIIAIIYIYDNSIIKTLELHILGVQTIKFASDLTTICFITQLFSTIMLFTRAIGFSLKKFNFASDLELDIDETDNEEFEFDIDYDSNKTKRNFKRIIRNLKYSYAENKVLYIIILVFSILLVGAFIYVYRNVIHKVYKENTVINTEDTSLVITKSYITNTNYKNEIVTDNYLVVVQAGVKKTTYKNIKFKTADFILKIGDINYHVTNKYSDAIKDLGVNYNGDPLSDNYKNYLFVFEIPKSQLDKKMLIKYSSKKIKLNPSKFDKGIVSSGKLKSDLIISNQSYSNLKLNISSYEIADKIKANYQVCYSSNDCANNYEYIVPTLTDNYDKAVLKLVSKTDLSSIVERHAVIKYKINNETKTMNEQIKRIIPQKQNDANIYYFEIKDEIKNASSISLLFLIRNDQYEYVIK